MKALPRLLFWLGAVSLGYGIVLKIVNFYVESPSGWPFGMWPKNFLDFSLVCFVATIAFCVVFIFIKKAEE